MSTSVTERKPVEAGEHHVSLEDIRHQILSFGTQIHEYLGKVEADVEGYRFTVEKHGDGVEVEVQFKAFIHGKSSPAAKIIPK